MCAASVVLAALALALWAPGAFAQDAYVANFEENSPLGSVSVINTETNKVVGSPITVGKEPEAIAITPDGNTAYVTNFGSDNVSVIDLSSKSVEATIGVGTEPVAVAITPNGKSAYVVNAGSEDISVIDTETNEVTDTISVEHGPWGIAITPDGKFAYVADVKGSRVSVIDLSTNQVTESIGVEQDNPLPIEISPDGKRVYVANFAEGKPSGSVSVIDTESKQVVGEPIKVGKEPWGVGVSPDGKRVYIANEGEETVSVINAETDQVVGEPIKVGKLPYVVTFTPDGKTAYVPNSGTDTVSVIDTETEQVKATIEVGADPEAVAIPPDQPPVASFSVPVALSGTPVGFDASASSDPDGSIADYDWEFGDGSTETSGGPSPQHTYANRGSYEATLTVTDNEGCSTEIIFTGQTASCAGSALARETKAVTVSGRGLSVSLSPESILANGASTTTITAKASGADEEPLAAQEVGFSSSDGGDRIGPVSETAPGTYSAVLTSSDTAGTATITATDTSVKPAVIATARLDQTSAASPSASSGSGAEPSPAPEVTGPTTTPSASCVVPRLIGQKLSSARRRLRATACSLGAVRGARSRSERVAAQKPRPGMVLGAGTKVSLKLK